jgi:hypothetical protein
LNVYEETRLTCLGFWYDCDDATMALLFPLILSGLALYMWMKWDRTSIIDDPWAAWGMDGVQGVSMAGSRHAW